MQLILKRFGLYISLAVLMLSALWQNAYAFPCYGTCDKPCDDYWYFGRKLFDRCGNDRLGYCADAEARFMEATKKLVACMEPKIQDFSTPSSNAAALSIYSGDYVRIAVTECSGAGTENGWTEFNCQLQQMKGDKSSVRAGSVRVKTRDQGAANDLISNPHDVFIFEALISTRSSIPTVYVWPYYG